MSIASMLERAVTSLDAFCRTCGKNIKRRRVHVIAAYYYIGVWQALEPLIAFFGFSERTVHFIRNVGISFFPFILVFTWFHGEPGRQRFSRKEGIAYLPTLLVIALLFLQLSKAPVPKYVIVAPLSPAEVEWYDEHILKDFEQKNHVQLTIHSTGDENDRELLKQLASPDSSVLLVRIPLHLTSVVFKERSNGLLSYDELTVNSKDKKVRGLKDWIHAFDSTSIEWGRKHDGRLYYLPAEFQTEILIYSKASLEDVIASWETDLSEALNTFERLCHLRWPDQYIFESDPDRWDWYDIFVFTWHSIHRQRNGQKTHTFAFPTSKKELSLILLNKSLQFGVPVSTFFNLRKLGVYPPPEMIHMFTWDALFREAGLFYDGMWQGEGLWSREVAEAYRNEEIDIAIVNSTDAASFIDIEDVGFAPFPKSPDGERASIPAIWYWAIPRNTPDTKISLLLADWLTTEENQLKLCRQFGTIPTRKTLIESGGEIAFRQPNMKKLYAASRQQLTSTVSTVVSPFKDLTFSGNELVQEFYHGKWSNMMIERNYLSANGTISKDRIVGELTTIP